MTSEAVLVFARRPEIGQVKTRLDACLGEELTLSLYHAFLEDTLTASRQSGATTILAHTPGPPFPEQRLADFSFAQLGNSFGERFDYSLAEAARRLPAKTRLVLIGADTPQLSPTLLRTALQSLSDCDAVIGPNDNGGFYLLGFSTPPIPVAEVFAHSASDEPRELARILMRSDLRTKLLEPQFDVDLPEDLMKLIRLFDELESNQVGWIPENTRDLLRSRSFSVMVQHQTDYKLRLQLP